MKRIRALAPSSTAIRGAIELAGVVCICIAAFALGVAAGFAVSGVMLILAANLAWRAEDDNAAARTSQRSASDE
jgi:hypothetical protein